MNNVLQTQNNALVSFQQAISPGKVMGIFLYITGTNALGITSALADLGDVIVKRNGRTIVNRKWKTLSKLIDIRFGSNLFSSTEASSFVATLFIPFYEEGLEQSLMIEGDSELVFEYNPKTSTVSNWDALNLTVYSTKGYETVPEFYEYRILGDDQAISGAVDKPFQLNDDNVTAVFLEDGSGVVTQVGFRNNNGQIFSSQPWDVLLGQTLIWNRLETTTFTMTELQLFSKAEASSYLNKANIIEIETDGAGVVEVTKCMIVPNQKFAQLLK